MLWEVKLKKKIKKDLKLGVCFAFYFIIRLIATFKIALSLSLSFMYQDLEIFPSSSLAS